MPLAILKPRRRRRWYHHLSFEFRYYVHIVLSAIAYTATGLKLILKNETVWFYSYTENKLFILTGLEYIRYVSVDSKETAWLMINDKFHSCEKF